MRGARPINECRVLCAPSTFGKRDPSLRSALEAAVREVIYNPYGRPLKSAEVGPLLNDVDGFIAGIDEVDASALEEADRLRIIARYGVGIDRVDVAAATAKGIVVTNTPGANSAAVAELTIALILSLARHIIRADGAVRRGGWPVLDGIGIRGKTVGLVGFGSVGREVATRLKGFDCRLLASDPYVETQIADRYGASLVPLEKLVSEADFVSLHAPATEATVGMVNEEFLSLMKNGAFLINTARGDLIDDHALIAALESGRLQGAALDCFSQEPPDRSSKLFQLPSVIVTPHTAAHTDDAISQMGWTALGCCLAALRGETPEHIVNPEVLKRN
jgi:D-3-phosphoglycerate dehydrogenase / 2-oxoglutarate reductase